MIDGKEKIDKRKIRRDRRKKNRLRGQSDQFQSEFDRSEGQSHVDLSDLASINMNREVEEAKKGLRDKL